MEEYKIITLEKIPQEKFQAKLNEMAKERWKLIYVKNMKFDMYFNGDFYIIFEREFKLSKPKKS